MESQNNNTNNIGAMGLLIDKSYINTTKVIYEKIARFNDKQKAFELSGLLKELLMNNRTEIKQFPEIYNFYKRIIIRMRLIALPLLDEDEIIELTKNYFTMHYKIPYYNFIDNLKTFLIPIVLIEQRDKIKQNIKNALLSNSEVITPNGRIRTVVDWLKNYNTNLGTNIPDKLKKTEYLVSLTRDKTINSEDVVKLKTLFEVYEFLQISAKTIAGMEEEYPVMVDGKLHIFRKGFLEPVPDFSDEILEGLSLNKTETPSDQLTQLKAMANQYALGSLERMAVEEEIGKLEGSGENALR